MQSEQVISPLVHIYTVFTCSLSQDCESKVRDEGIYQWFHLLGVADKLYGLVTNGAGLSYDNAAGRRVTIKL